MEPTETLTSAIEQLRKAIDGDAFVPGDADWDQLRLAWNLCADQNPAAIVFCESAHDAVKAINFARDNGLRVAPQSTGHGAVAMEPLDDVLLVKVNRMNSVEIDPEARTARVGAGSTWGEVVPAAAEHGLAALAGSSPDVGVAGYTLGGGAGWLARQHGFSCNNVVAIEVVTADGVLCRVDADNEPDLFWALRGGGGSFGVVTELVLKLFPITEIYSGALFWPAERARDVLQAWREWTATAPEEVTSCGRIMHFPPLPEIPEPMRGNSFAVVEIAFLGSEAEGAELIEPLVGLDPAMTTVGLGPVSDLAELHMDPPQPVPGLGDGVVLSELPAEAIDALVDAAGSDSGTALLSAEIRHVGGACGRADDSHGALGSIDHDYVYFGVGMAMDEQMAKAVEASLDRLSDALSPWDSGRLYSNFAERPTDDPASFFTPEAFARLLEVRAIYDPDGFFHANHQIRTAA